MRRAARRPLVIAAAAALALGAVVISSSATAQPSGARDHPRLAGRQILRIANTAAASAVDPRPTLIQHSQGTRYRANLVDSGDIVPGKAWCYLIAERGHFVFSDAPRPPGARAPSGSVITLVVDASAREITDSGVSDRFPKLAALGPVTTDLRRAPAATGTPQSARDPSRHEVLVPNTAGMDINHAYASLHQAGFRVSYLRSFSEGSSACWPIIAHEQPAAVSQVTPGLTIKLIAPPSFCPIASPFLPVGQLPSFKVPNFAEQRLDNAVHWAYSHNLHWEADNLPRLVGGDASTLFANYQVVKETPRAGSRLKLGIETRHGNEGTFLMTPLILHRRTTQR
jgi:hypothetical protein